MCVALRSVYILLRSRFSPYVAHKSTRREICTGSYYKDEFALLEKKLYTGKGKEVLCIGRTVSSFPKDDSVSV